MFGEPEEAPAQLLRMIVSDEPAASIPPAFLTAVLKSLDEQHELDTVSILRVSCCASMLSTHAHALTTVSERAMRTIRVYLM